MRRIYSGSQGYAQQLALETLLGLQLENTKKGWLHVHSSGCSWRWDTQGESWCRRATGWTRRLGCKKGSFASIPRLQLCFFSLAFMCVSNPKHSIGDQMIVCFTVVLERKIKDNFIYSNVYYLFCTSLRGCRKAFGPTHGRPRGRRGERKWLLSRVRSSNGLYKPS